MYWHVHIIIIAGPEGSTEGSLLLKHDQVKRQKSECIHYNNTGILQHNV